MHLKLLLRISKLLPSELAHDMAILALKLNLLPNVKINSCKMLEQKIFGQTFVHPVGLAAGFDKNASAIDGLSKQGFGFLEFGTVTPRAQSGNAKPRLFRFDKEKAIINAMGFNNLGIENFINNISSVKDRSAIIGINIGKNKDTIHAIEDYGYSLQKLYEYANYIVINISSPNTVGLRNLQHSQELIDLLQKISLKRIELSKKYKRYVPMIVKLSPDLADKELYNIADILKKYMIDGVILTNTTISRPENGMKLQNRQQGGLSGQPLFDLSNRVIAKFYQYTQGSVPIIASGGVLSAQDAYQKIKYGASLVQLYSAIIFYGFDIVKEIVEGLENLLIQDGHVNISQAIGIEAHLITDYS